MARCGVTDINNDQLCKKPKCHEEKGKINAHLEQDKLTGATNAKLGHIPVGSNLCNSTLALCCWLFCETVAPCWGFIGDH
jgi:hypothetical protein